MPGKRIVYPEDLVRRRIWWVSSSSSILEVVPKHLYREGDTPPSPSPAWRYPVESRFNILASDIVQGGETLNVSARIRVYRRLADPFGTTS